MALSSLKYLIEALRGGNSDEGVAARKSMRSYYNPTGQTVAPSNPYQSGGPGGYGMQAGLRDPEYLKYVKSTPNPMPYMDWVAGNQ